jgi:endonuclease/exonuclease/phosphatase family metal-dependent hydrolase
MLAFFVAFVALLTSRAGAAEPPTRCMPRPVAAATAAEAASQPPHETLTVGSLNMAADMRTLDALEAWTRQRSIDVVLLQEVGDDGSDGEQLMAALSQSLGFNFAYAPANLRDHGETEGLAIASRYALDDVRVQALAYHDLPFRSRCRVALSATALTPLGPVRFVNVHLDTRINGDTRVEQLMPAVDALASFDGPRVLGGDLNTMDIHWIGSTLPLFYAERQTVAVRTWMASRGYATPFTTTPATLPMFILPMKADWLFLKGLESTAEDVDQIQYSDHRGIWARLRPTTSTAVRGRP